MKNEYYPFSHEICHHFYDNGGCIFCGYYQQKRSVSEKPVSIDEQIRHFDSFAEKNLGYIIKTKRLVIAPNGSWFVEVPKKLREHIYNFIEQNNIPNLKYETRADLFSRRGTEKGLDKALEEIQPNHIVSLGLEVADDADLLTLNKGCCLADYVQVASYVHEGDASVCCNILLAPPRIKNPMHKAFQTAKFATEEMETDELLIMPCIPMKNTPAYQDWIEGKWNPISATAASEIFRIIKKEYPKIRTRYLDLRVYRFHGRHGKFKRKPGKWKEEEKLKERRKVRKIAEEFFTPFFPSQFSHGKAVSPLFFPKLL